MEWKKVFVLKGGVDFSQLIATRLSGARIRAREYASQSFTKSCNENDYNSSVFFSPSGTADASQVMAGHARPCVVNRSKAISCIAASITSDPFTREEFLASGQPFLRLIWRWVSFYRSDRTGKHENKSGPQSPAATICKSHHGSPFHDDSSDPRSEVSGDYHPKWDAESIDYLKKSFSAWRCNIILPGAYKTKLLPKP
jgi:hypothetical protein